MLLAHLEAPHTWTCDADDYGAGDSCDCDCTIVDPDCELDVPVVNCLEGQVCVNGSCGSLYKVTPEFSYIQLRDGPVSWIHMVQWMAVTVTVVYLTAIA